MAAHSMPSIHIYATLIYLILAIVFLLSSVGSSFDLPNLRPSTLQRALISLKSRSLQTLPTSANEPSFNVTDDCFEILNNVVVGYVMNGGGRTKEENFRDRYRVFLKLYATHKDTLQLLKTQPLKNAVPLMIYDQGKDRGIAVQLSLQQVCDVYRLPMVGSQKKDLGKE